MSSMISRGNNDNLEKIFISRSQRHCQSVDSLVSNWFLSSFPLIRWGTQQTETERDRERKTKGFLSLLLSLLLLLLLVWIWVRDRQVTDWHKHTSTGPRIRVCIRHNRRCTFTSFFFKFQPWRTLNTYQSNKFKWHYWFSFPLPINSSLATLVNICCQ